MSSATAHYRKLVALGRAEFLAAAAPAALVRYRGDGDGGDEHVPTLTIEETVEDTTMPIQRFAMSADEIELEVFPLAKKPGASFPDRITIGRTGNNDVVIPDHSISRLHAYMRRAGHGWVVADAGSKNGSTLRGEVLEARKEKPVGSKMVLRLGEIELTFYAAADLYAALGGL